MTKQEALQIIYVMKANFPGVKYDENSLKTLVNTWEAIARTYSPNDIMQALMSYLADKNPYPPTIGQLIDLVEQKKTPVLESRVDPVYSTGGNPTVNPVVLNAFCNYWEKYRRGEISQDEMWREVEEVEKQLGLL